MKTTYFDDDDIGNAGDLFDGVNELLGDGG